MRRYFFGRFLCKTLILVYMALMSSVIMYAWFSNAKEIGRTEINTGELDPALMIEFYDDSREWTGVSVDGTSASFFPRFGVITDFTELPDDSDVFVRVRVTDDNPDLKFIYHVLVSNIIITVTTAYDQSSGSGFYSDADDHIKDDHIDMIDYFSQATPQSCMEYHYVSKSTEVTDNNPEQNNFFSDESIHIASRNQSLSDGNYITHDKWVYLKIQLRLEELYNILRYISTDYMPYTLWFRFEITAEVRTLD